MESAWSGVLDDDGRRRELEGQPPGLPASLVIDHLAAGAVGKDKGKKKHTDAAVCVAMRFCALVSGGKDSVYAIIESEEAGHTLVCCANLHPLDETADEIDSWMYQSAAHRAVPGVAECLGVPLVRRGIRGKAACRELEYEACEGDEVEDLLGLLSEVQASYPDVEAVSSGAILSNYQRHRVENVCARLGLVSLAYLWQRPQRRLLREMSRHVEAIIVKTASMGLEPSRHLGRTIDELQGEFERLNDKFGFHECGEGGEYETLVIDSRRFRTKRLVLDQLEPVIDDSLDGGALRVVGWHTEPKTEHWQREPLQLEATPERILSSDTAPPPCDVVALRPPPRGDAPRIEKFGASSSVASGLVSISLVSRGGPDVATAVTVALGTVRARLAQKGLGFRDCVYAHLYLDDMSAFKAANAAYVEALEGLGRNVPSRACIGIVSRDDVRVRVDVDALAPGHSRRTLSVRSISKWAPVCIGPYCQANVVGDAVVLVAGQIPLDAATMRLADPGDRDLALCLGHNDAVLRACDSTLVLGYVVYGLDDLAEAASRLEKEAPAIVVGVPALPAGALLEVQVAAATRRAAPFFVRRRFVLDDRAVECSAQVADRAGCVAALHLASHGSAAALVEACLYVVRDVAGLRLEHWSRLRVFVLGDDLDTFSADLRRGLSHAFPEPRPPALTGPALSVIPVLAVHPSTARAAAHVFACDLDRFRADFWIHGK